MSKAFTKETDDDDELSPLPEMPAGVKNYITPAGYRQLQKELSQLLEQRNDAFAAASPERAQREIEPAIHYLQTRLEAAEVVDPSVHAGEEQIFFGATVTYRHENGTQQSVTIVGLDELDPANGKISWLSPVAQALLTAHEGDDVMLESPAGSEALQILTVRYPPRETGGEPESSGNGDME